MVEVGVILCLTAGPKRRAFGYCSSYRSIQSAANIKGGGVIKLSNNSAVFVLDQQAAGGKEERQRQRQCG